MELAGLARRLVDSGRFGGVVCLGAVIRGGTPHFDLVAGEAARAIGALAAEGRVPVSFGVLACDTLEQALARAGDQKEENRGYDAALVVIEMADLYAQLR
jgi:6,7-dimethyl-8-ribityllumazine synthase